MRRHTRMVTLAVLPLALGLIAACRSEPQPSSPPAQATGQAPEQPGTEGDIAPQTAESPAPPAGAGAGAEAPPASPTVGPPASPATSVPRSSRTPPASSPSIGAAAPTPAPAGAPSVATTPAASAAPVPAPSAPTPAARLVELPSGTALPIELTTSAASDTSAVEDPVTARVTSDVEVNGATVIPQGSTVAGRVTYAKESGKVKGLAALTVRFYTVTVGSRTYDIAAEPVRLQAQPTKGKDAQKIGIGAGAGAVVGGLLGGRKGAAIGAAAGGAGGTGVVLATKGEEVGLDVGTRLDLRLTEPLAVTVR